MRRVFLDIETLPPERELAEPNLTDEEYPEGGRPHPA